MNIQHELATLLGEFERNNPVTIFRDREVYGQWLAQTFYYVQHSTALLGYALPRLPADLRRHFEKHLGEESRHDLLLIKDLEKLGYKFSDFPESHITQAFYQSQYFRINFEHGTSLLGYILYLEALATGWGKEAYDFLKNTHKGSTLFLKVHAEEDPSHVEQALGVILKLSELEQASIIRNLRYTHEMYSLLVGSLKKQQVLLKVS